MTLVFVGLLILTTASAPVQAQLDPTEPTRIGQIELALEDGVLEPEPPGQAQGRMQVTLRSLQSDARGTAHGSSPITLRGEVVPSAGNTTSGWSVSFAPQAFTLDFGETKNVTVYMSATMNAEPTEVLGVINVTALISRRHSSYTVSTETSVIGRVAARRFAAVFLTEPPPTVGPRDVTQTRVRLSNSGFYPDQYHVGIENTGPLTVATPGTVGLGAGQTRDIPITIFGPETIHEYGQMEIIQVTATSASDPSVSFTRSMVVNVDGFYLPPWTFPLWVVLVALAAYGGQRTYEKVKRDRRRYGHPAPRYTEEQKEKLEQLKERDKEKYKAVKARLDERYEEQLAAYKERKRKGKARSTGAILAKMAEKRKEEEKLRKSGLKTVKKLKKKGEPPEAIYQALEPGEREQLGDDLPEILQAPTAAGALIAARDDDEEMGAVDKMRARKAETEEKRLRAEALMLIEHRREEGYDPEQIREELSVPQKLALGDDLEFALEGEP